MPKELKSQKNLENQAKEIMRIAEEYGVQSNYFLELEKNALESKYTL